MLATIEPTLRVDFAALWHLFGKRRLQPQIQAWNSIVNSNSTLSRPFQLTAPLGKLLRSTPHIPLLAYFSAASDSRGLYEALRAELVALNESAARLRKVPRALQTFRTKLWNPTEWYDATAELLVAGSLAQKCSALTFEIHTSGTRKNYDLYALTPRGVPLHIEIKSGEDWLSKRSRHSEHLAGFQDLLRQDPILKMIGLSITLKREPYSEEDAVNAAIDILTQMGPGAKLVALAPKGAFWRDARVIAARGFVMCTDGTASLDDSGPKLHELLTAAATQLPRRPRPPGLRIAALVRRHYDETDDLQNLLQGPDGLWSSKSFSHVDACVFITRHPSQQNFFKPGPDYHLRARAYSNPKATHPLLGATLTTICQLLRRDWSSRSP